MFIDAFARDSFRHIEQVICTIYHRSIRFFLPCSSSQDQLHIFVSVAEELASGRDKLDREDKP